MEKSLSQLEADVEAARARVATDLALLTSDATQTQLLDSAHVDLNHLKNRAVSSAMDSAQSTLSNVVETLKAKAAQNPAAVLAVAAGVGWRIYKSPPIASALVGLGLYSLFNSKAEPTAHPMETAKRRAKEQVASAVESVRAGAASVADNVLDKADELAQPARDASSDILSEARKQLRDAQDAITERARWAKDQAPSLFGRNDNTAWDRTAALGDSTQLRDTALLAFAGIAIAASVGLAWQKRSSIE